MADNCGCPREGESAGMTRASFLGWIAGGIGGLIALVLGGAGGGYFMSPAFNKDEESWIDVGAAKDVKAGTPVKVDFVARKRDAWVVTEKRASAWVTTKNGKDFTVFDPRCTHLGCPYRWDEASKEFKCPCHSAVFSADGAVVAGPPPRPLDQYPVKVAEGRLMINPQAQAEGKKA
jgi:menaquinol-cytochrome c reductase iron-sulfur subunit